MVEAMDVEGMLRRIGATHEGPPSVAGLSGLHTAYVDQVPYETVQYQLGGGGPLEPEEVARRIVGREAGGYCFQLNGVFGLLLTRLGYQVEMHRGGVQTPNRPGTVDGSHMVLTVTGMVDAPGETWVADAGLGESLTRPIPLEEGAYRQEPYDLRLRRSEQVDGWRLDHDPRSSLLGMDFESATVQLESFEEQHAYLSKDPDSPFVRLCSAFRRRPSSVLVLRSVGLTETTATSVDNSLLETSKEYFEALADLFHLPLPHYSAADRDTLWRRVWAQYQDFLSRQA